MVGLAFHWPMVPAATWVTGARGLNPLTYNFLQAQAAST